jgi:hypothetical protein
MDSSKGKVLPLGFSFGPLGAGEGCGTGGTSCDAIHVSSVLKRQLNFMCLFFGLAILIVVHYRALGHQNRQLAFTGICRICVGPFRSIHLSFFYAYVELFRPSFVSGLMKDI